MKSKPIFITEKEWFESTALKNPVTTLDHSLKQFFPDFYRVSYDTKLLATKAEVKTPFSNDYRERFGTTNLLALDAAIADSDARYIFLNGFNQNQFSHIAPLIKDTAEILYFFKCPRISDLSILSQFPKLKCVHIYWNNSLESLWDMTGNPHLKVLSFQMISKLRHIEALKDSTVEYICFDSSDNSGNKKKALFDASVFTQMSHLKHLSLVFSENKSPRP